VIRGPMQKLNMANSTPTFLAFLRPAIAGAARA